MERSLTLVSEHFSLGLGCKSTQRRLVVINKTSVDSYKVFKFSRFEFLQTLVSFSG